jgi:long-chain acyl-CoA synthetase
MNNVAGLLIRSAGRHPSRPALAFGPRIITDYATLASRVASIAGAMSRRFALVEGDRVALFMANCPQYVELLFACWHAGFVAVPINAKLHPKELGFILDNAGARLCFVNGEYETHAMSEAPRDLLEIIDVGTPAYERLAASSGIELVETAADDVAWLFYTSGTTGRPKGVMITHRNLLALTLNYFADLDTIDEHDSIVHAAPMSHGSGLYLPPHVARAALSVAPESGGFDPEEVHRLLDAHRGVTMFLAPTMVKRLVDCPTEPNVSHLKTIVYGGGPMYVEQCRGAIARFGYKLAQIYGQGEAPMTITVMNKAVHALVSHPRYDERLASVGQAFTGVRVRVADESDQPVPDGRAGEILVRGDVVMRGYWQNDEATAETLRGGWLHTGDVGTQDEEGFITLKDRSKDVIISGGANIYPREVEEVLLRHPLVAEASVVGVPDAEWGEQVVAFVVTTQGGDVTIDELDRLCLDNIARFKRPRRWEFVDALPKTMTGKVLKTALRTRLVDRTE